MRETLLSFFIPGEPVAFARSGGNGGIRFTPKKQRSHAGVIKTFALDAMERAKQQPFTQPLALTITVSYVAPKSWSKKKPASTIFKTSKPDIDNLAKLIMDGCNQIVWQDDAQIALLVAQKSYGTVAGTKVTVELLSGDAE